MRTTLFFSRLFHFFCAGIRTESAQDALFATKIVNYQSVQVLQLHPTEHHSAIIPYLFGPEFLYGTDARGVVEHGVDVCSVVADRSGVWVQVGG